MPSEPTVTPTNRRSFLKRGVAGLASLGLFSGVSSASGGLSKQYSTVIDVTEHGADPTGGEPVNGVVSNLMDDDTLLKFPKGRYYVDDKTRFTDFENFGMVGDDATLVPADYHDFRGNDHKLFRLGVHYAPGRDLHFEGFTVDQTAPDTGVRVLDVAVSDGLTVKDVHVKGRHDSGTWGPALFRVTDRDGSGLVERFRAPAGAAGTGQAPANHLWRGPSGILCTWAHYGDMTFRDCVLGGFPDNGLYAAGGNGDVVVEGGRYANSGTASIRVGGRRVYVRGADVVVDEQPWNIPQEGIRLQDGGWLVVEDTNVSMPNPTGEAINVGNAVGGAFVKNSSIHVGEDATVGVQINPDTGPTYMKDVDIEIEDSNNAVQIEGENAGEVGLVDVDITGDAGGETMRNAIRCLRNDCYFYNVSIDQTGGNERRGIGLFGERSRVVGCDINVAERGITIRNDHAWVQDTRCTSYGDARTSILVDETADDVRLKHNEFTDGIAR